MAVVVKETTENFYKVHRIVTPDGSVFKFEQNKAALPNDGGVTENSSLAASTSSASNNSISQTRENTTKKMQQPRENFAPLPQKSETVPTENETNSRPIAPLPEKVAPVQQKKLAPLREDLQEKKSETVKERNAAKVERCTTFGRSFNKNTTSHILTDGFMVSFQIRPLLFYIPFTS